ncbi:GNAT family N-acetyltransferase [Zhouia sp. PK063]|uniref:GNAT family N-acetyltransferase n=1 Tax=Zhouia sp. PK063 TaxID=3373602 RepID=UPI0037BA3711
MHFITIHKNNFNQIAQIYAEGLASKMATFETAVPNWEKWNEKYLPFARIALANNDNIIGWAALTAVSTRKVYKGVAEVSIYLRKTHQGKGLGKAILNKLIAESEVHGIWTLQSGIFSINTASIKLHESCGFRIIGYREKIGCLNQIWYDNTLMERRSKTVGI